VIILQIVKIVQICFHYSHDDCANANSIAKLMHFLQTLSYFHILILYNNYYLASHWPAGVTWSLLYGRGINDLDLGLNKSHTSSQSSKFHANLVLHEIEAHGNKCQAKEYIHNTQDKHVGGRFKRVTRHVVAQAYGGKSDETEVEAYHVIVPSFELLK
jgi:hypothetical protein